MLPKGGSWFSLWRDVTYLKVRRPGNDERLRPATGIKISVALVNQFLQACRCSVGPGASRALTG